jgi:two-component system, OmpR family, response regulator
MDRGLVEESCVKKKTVKRRDTVLVVDDDPHFRELYHTALQFRGLSVTTASDGLAALQSIQADRPAIVILDLNMPCVDGWAVLRELASNEDTKAIPVIVVTAADVTRAVGQAVAILQKPVLPDQIMPLIERHLRRAG